MDWIDLLQIGTGSGALVNAVMNFWVHKMWRISCLAEYLLASQEGLYSMELLHFSCVLLN